jgi:hypothetical protein
MVKKRRHLEDRLSSFLGVPDTSVNAKERPFGITFTAIARKAKLSRSSAKVTSSFTAIAKRISKTN